MVLEGIKYGFPIQYSGPPQYQDEVPTNNTSALKFSAHVKTYIEREQQHGALEGPFTNNPFHPWFVISPLMTREKAESEDRRVIVDLSFPEGGINRHIAPHQFEGQEATHNLPTVEAAIKSIAEMCPGDVHMSVIDLSRAYRPFPVSPLDWPLLGIAHEGLCYFDRRIPFGSRMSSFIMQSVAQFIIRAMEARGIVAHMYLDDIIIIAATKEIATRHYAQTYSFWRPWDSRWRWENCSPPPRG